MLLLAQDALQPSNHLLTKAVGATSRERLLELDAPGIGVQMMLSSEQGQMRVDIPVLGT